MWVLFINLVNSDITIENNMCCRKPVISDLNLKTKTSTEGIYIY